MFAPALALATLTGASLVAGAAETPTAILPEVLITATRQETPLYAVPYTAEVFDASRLQAELMARSIPEALREVPGVMVQKTAHGQGSPFIRGFTGFRTLFLIDGIRLNNSTFRDGPNQYWNTIDPFSVGRLELVKGPSSALYGSDAIGGTVSTLSAAIPGETTGRAYYRLASTENSHTGRVEGSASEGALGVRGGVTVKSYGDLNDLPQTGYDEWDADLKAEYRLASGNRLVAAFQHVAQDDAWRTHRTIYARPYAGSAVGSDRAAIYDQDRDLAYLQFHGDELVLSLSYQYAGEDFERVRSNGRRELSKVEVQTLGLWGQYHLPTEAGDWTFGAEYYRDWVRSGQTEYNADGSLRAVAIQGPVADDATYDLAGIFAQDLLRLGDRWEALLGARYTCARADAGRVRDPVTGLAIGLEDDWQSLVGNARLQWQADAEDHWRIFGGLSQGFRAPNLSDLTRLDIARSGEIETAAPGLDPEEFLTAEIGAKARFEEFRAEVAYFYTDIHRMIVRAPTGGTVNSALEVTKRNSGDGFVQGCELSLSWRFHPQFTGFGWATWMEGEVEGYPTSNTVGRTEPLSRVMPLGGEVGLRWQDPGRPLWIEGVVLLADRADRLSASDLSDNQRIPPGGTPGYTVASLRAGWRFHPRFGLTVACENLFDEEYRVHGSGINEAERNFVVAAEASF